VINRLLLRLRSSLLLLILSLIILPFFVVLPYTGAEAGPGGGFIWPVDGPVIRGFEKPTGPYGEGGHQGVDIAADRGIAVRSSAEGRVEWVGELPRGRFLSISHAGGVRTTYLDLERIEVARGERVMLGQVIATVSGGRDGSSPRPHLHFDVYVHGTPVDPRLFIGGLGGGSCIRLCPVERERGAGQAGPTAGEDAGSLWPHLGRGLRSVFSVITRPAGWLCRGIKSGLSAAWNGAVKLWDHYIFPALDRAGHAIDGVFQRMWNNRWVKAVVAGIAAALVVVAVIALAVLTLGLSVVAAVVAAVAASVAAIGYSLYYAATHGTNFSFLSCFAGSLSAGAVAAGLAASVVSLAGAFSAGWAQLGLWGATKAALWNGSLSALFEGGQSYIFTGHISWKSMLIAFGVGALSGATGRVLHGGLSSGRALELISVATSPGRSRIVALGRSLLFAAKERAAGALGLLLAVKDSAISIGTNFAYLGFSGTFGVTLNALVCTLSGRPMTVSGTLASFFTGVAMGAVALSYGGRGISGMLEKLRVFREGLGKALKGLAAAVLGKGIHKGLNLGFRNLFKRLLGEEVEQ